MQLDGTFFVRLRARPRGIHFIDRFPHLEAANLTGFVVVLLYYTARAFIG